jgi:predicted transcriptional regulator
LSSAADSSMREQSLQEHIAGVKVKDVMNRNPQCISPAASLESIIHEYFMRQGIKALPVCNDMGLMGIVTIADVKRVPQEEWSNTTVQAVMTQAPLDSVSEEDDLSKALKTMSDKSLNQLPVVSQGKMIGLLSRADIIRYLQTQQQLGIKNKPRPDAGISDKQV